MLMPVTTRAILLKQGKLDEAIEAYNKALSIRPDFAEAHRNLSSIKKYTEDDNHIVQVEELYKQRFECYDKCHLSYIG